MSSPSVHKALHPSHLQAFEAIVGGARIKSKDITTFFDAGINKSNLDAGILLLPESVEEVQALVSYCAEHRIAMVPHGGRTGISGGAETHIGQVIVQTTRMNRILSLDDQAGTALVESGVTLQQLQHAAEPHGLSVGVDLAARGSATIGGMVSTNAGGTEAFRHGVMRHRVLGLEAVLADGSVLRELKEVVKANEGFDVKQLLIGAEGTLGIVTKVALNLVPLSRGRCCALVSCDSAAHALKLFKRLRLDADAELLCAEIMWPDYAYTTAEELGKRALLDFAPGDASLFVIVDVTSASLDFGRHALEQALMHAMEAGEITDAVIAKNEREREEFWLIRDESFLCDRRYPHGFWFDVSVPHRRLDEYVVTLFRRVASIDSSLRVFLFGHLGDGNLHLTVSAGRELPEFERAIEQAVCDGLDGLGGSFSAEHGIGAHKRAALARYGSPEKLSLMRKIKRLLDPDGILNPQKVL